MTHGLSVKQMARRVQVNTATAYHLVRTLTYCGYLARREDGTYVPGPQVTARYLELVQAYQSEHLRHLLGRAARRSGYTHLLAELVTARPTITALAAGPRSPVVPEFLPGFQGPAHTTAWGKALLGTLSPDDRQWYVKEHGLQPRTTQTLARLEALETNILIDRAQGLHRDQAEYRQDVAALAVLVKTKTGTGALGCLVPRAELGRVAEGMKAKLGRLAEELEENASNV